MTDQSSQQLSKITRQVFKGARAGFIATIPMSLVMARLYYQLPHAERYPLPPNQIVGAVVDEDQPVAHQIATISAHFAYGAAAGAFYNLALGRIPLPKLLKGLTFGMAVWLVSYQGWLPALRILPPATQQPPNRNYLMIVAHLVWGAILALLGDNTRAI